MYYICMGYVWLCVYVWPRCATEEFAPMAFSTTYLCETDKQCFLAATMLYAELCLRYSDVSDGRFVLQSHINYFMQIESTRGAHNFYYYC